MDDNLLAEFAHIEPCYVDGLAGVCAVGGDNLAMMFFRLQPIGVDNGRVRLEKVPAVTLVRPRKSFYLCNQNCTFSRIIREVQEEQLTGLLN
jgi:hypothetical protein